jgi:hypothetical protein
MNSYHVRTSLPSPPSLPTDDEHDGFYNSQSTSPASASDTLYTLLFECLTRSVKEVRFFIADSASESDSSETKGQYFKPQDPAPVMHTLKSGSKWTAKDLQCLSVEYDPEKVYPINIPATDISPGLAERTIYLPSTY